MPRRRDGRRSIEDIERQAARLRVRAINNDTGRYLSRETQARIRRINMIEDRYQRNIRNSRYVQSLTQGRVPISTIRAERRIYMGLNNG